MKYTNNDHITNIDEVKAFASYLVNNLGVNLHPDNDFAEYVCYETGERTFTEEEAAVGNRLMDECFEVCANSKIGIYELLLPILQNYVSKGGCN